MLLSGERQVGLIKEIRRDHVARYEWVAARANKCKVVDLACGIGYGSHLMAKAGCTVLGVDIDTETIEYARNNYGHVRARYMQGDASELKTIGKHDIAVSFETIEHVADPRPLLKSLREASPVLVASVPNEDVMPYEFEPGKTYAFHHRHYTPQQFKELLNECGWIVTEWCGQLDDTSEVEQNVVGRTIIAVCERGNLPESPEQIEPPERKVIVQPSEKKPPAPDHVAILGLGPSVAEYLEFTKRMGGRRKFCDETWSINALGDVIKCDRVFHMDDVRIQQIRSDAKPESNIAAMLQWIKTDPGPIYTSRVHPDYPGLVAYPLEEVLNVCQHDYFNSTAAYAVAYAIYLGVKKITMFGCDFTYPDAHDAEKGRACVEFWLGVASERGILISLPKSTSLMDAMYTRAQRFYGYDTLDIDLVQNGKNVKVEFKERQKIETAEEVEQKYDHSAHPNPQVSKA